jgi:hypothetical protein
MVLKTSYILIPAEMKKTFAIFLLLVSFHYAFSQNFIKETASSMGPGTSVGSYCNVAVSKDNKIHICHYDFLNKNLLYTTNESGTWQTTVVDSAGQVGEYCSIAVDGNNHAHISYFEFIRNDSLGGAAIPYGNLKYATNESGQWVSTVIDTASGLLTRICVDKLNYVHIVHTELGISDLVNQLLNIKYATNKSGIWLSAAIAPGVVKGADGSIAVDNNLKIHIAIRNEEGVGISPDGGMGGLRYITDLTGNWSWVDVDTNFNAGNDVDIAVDTANSPHISYLDKTEGLKYATNQSGTWMFSVLDTNHNVGWNTSIITDKNNHIHISYSDPSSLLDPPGNSYLKYISNSSGIWNILIVDSANAGMFTCIALDTNDLPHIAYTAINTSDGSGVLKHAYLPMPAGLTEIYNEQNKISIFPNPSSDGLFLKIGNYKSDNEIKIYNMQGCLQKSFHAENEITGIDISGLKQGIFLVEIRIDGVLQKSIKFIKQQ